LTQRHAHTLSGRISAILSACGDSEHGFPWRQGLLGDQDLGRSSAPLIGVETIQRRSNSKFDLKSLSVTCIISIPLLPVRRLIVAARCAAARLSTSLLQSQYRRLIRITDRRISSKHEPVYPRHHFSDCSSLPGGPGCESPSSHAPMTTDRLDPLLQRDGDFPPYDQRGQLPCRRELLTLQG
jgi:hypothetical protein